MAKKLVLIGGGHAHMVTLANLENFIKKGYSVTVIGPSEYHYYSGMGPGMLSKTYTPDDIRFYTRKVVEERGGSFILDSVVRIDPLEKMVLTKAGHQIPYDVLSCNAGSYVTDQGFTGDSDNVFAVKPIEKLLQAQRKIQELTSKRQIEIGIIGGGPSSAEVAGNIVQLVEKSGGHPPKIRIFAGTSFMKKFPDKVRRLVKHSLTRRGIEIIEDGHANLINATTIDMENGRRYEADLIFMATGVHPSTLFSESALPVGPDGGLLVNRYLQSEMHPEIFGGGDCIYFEEQPLDKVGVYAVRQNQILYHNLLAALAGTELKEFNPGGPYLLIFNLGNGDGVLHKYWLTFGGRLAFIIKDYIDRKFMRLFQAIEKDQTD
ncbi:MAG: FAD-dependent oxidoreductase [Thermodesulfobacteriota bacterium]